MSVAGYEAQKEYTFVSQAYPADTFQVVRFTGTEGISRLYEFDITLTAVDPEIDSRLLLQNPATLTITGREAEIPVHGILSEFEQLQEIDETVFYRAVLVPRLWQTSLYHENQLFLDKSVPDIIEEILNQAGLTSNDYDFRLTGTYEPWEYICQFRETDFNFISRWMEREGIYYYFEQTDSIDKVVITDSATAHENVSGETAIPYLPPSGQVPAEEDCVHVFTCRQQMLPAKVMLKDYNYRRPTLDLKGEADVDADGGRGTVYIYGEHFKTPEAGNALAAIRAQEFLCRERLFYGESTAANLCPGFLFELTDHYRDSYNLRYLVTELAHEGRSARFLFQGEGPPAADEPRMGYNNQFTLIPADVQFRPERESTRPRFYGSMNATIDAAGDGQYAEIDDEGRYKVILPFDQSGNSSGKASRWIRMAQPYAGANYGMHFPLHKGTEVLLTFVDGDPDRPIIAASIPNPDTMSPVIAENQTKSIIRTGGKNEIRLEDKKGHEEIYIYAKKDMNEKIENAQSITVGASQTISAGSDQTISVGKNRNVTVKQANDNLTVKAGTRSVTVKGDSSLTIQAGSRNVKVSGGNYSAVSTDAVTIVGESKGVAISGTGEGGVQIVGKPNFVGKGDSKAIVTSPEVFVQGESTVTISVGDSSIEVSGGGVTVNAEKIELSGSDVKINASGNVDVSGTAINLNS